LGWLDDRVVALHWAARSVATTRRHFFQSEAVNANRRGYQTRMTAILPCEMLQAKATGVRKLSGSEKRSVPFSQCGLSPQFSSL
jgi:hypothetical protein